MNTTFGTTKFLEIIHSVVCGPLNILSKGGARYFVTLIDNYSKWTTLYPIKAKNEVFRCVVQFMALVRRQTCSKLKALHTDGDGEYVSTEFSNFRKDRENTSRQTCAYTP